MEILRVTAGQHDYSRCWRAGVAILGFSIAWGFTCTGPKVYTLVVAMEWPKWRSHQWEWRG